MLDVMMEQYLNAEYPDQTWQVSQEGNDVTLTASRHDGNRKVEFAHTVDIAYLLEFGWDTIILGAINLFETEWIARNGRWN